MMCQQNTDYTIRNQISSYTTTCTFFKHKIHRLFEWGGSLILRPTGKVTDFNVPTAMISDLSEYSDRNMNLINQIFPIEWIVMYSE